jgi:uncharacterized membrane protein
VVELVWDPAGSECHWIIRPNQSLSWRGAVGIYTVIACGCLGFAVAFALHGFWPVLPFAGLEVIALGTAFYLCQTRSQQREVVTMGADVVTVEKGRRQPEEHWECPRVWARVLLEPAPIAWYPSRLTIAFRERRVEIGRFLGEAERRALAAELHRAFLDSSWHCQGGAPG